jgi:hypothetical protein
MLLAAAAGEAGASATDVLLAFVVANGACVAVHAPGRALRLLLCAQTGHVVVEALLLATIVFLLLQRSYKPDKKPLTERVRPRRAAARRKPGACECSLTLAWPALRRRSTRCARSGSRCHWCRR